MNDSINHRIARCRKLADLTQTEAAERLGMKTSTYSQMERHGNVSAERLLQLAEVFNVHPDELLYARERTVKPYNAYQAASVPETPADAAVSVKENPQLKQSDSSYKVTSEPHIILTQREENIIKIIRNLPKNERNDVISYIEKKYKENKNRKS